MIKFLLNGEWVTEANLDPNMSILRYLRTKKGLKGTKEGCASGDCGACTVLIGDSDEATTEYRSVNSCISFLGDMNGKHIVTVDGVNEGESVHPVQESMVNNHGSQCGFCTPGIVMSLVGLNESKKSACREDVLTALSGNLCRCTGYRSIIDAALEADKMPCSNSVINSTPAWKQPELEATAGLSENDHYYFAPTSESELSTLLKQYPQARFVAGATDLALEVTQQYKQIEYLISLSNVAELSTYTEGETELSIGASATYSAVMPWLAKWYPQVVELFERIGSLQIRNRGTIGGNVANASPIGDTPPILLALDAKLELATADSSRVVAIKDFFTGYKQTLLGAGEYIKTISIPKPKPESTFKLYKISKRFEDDISAVMAAFYIEVEDEVVTTVRLAFGGMAATPEYAEKAQASLLGKSWSLETVESAMEAIAEDFTPMTDVRASDKYRIKMAQNLLMKAYLEMTEGTEIGVLNHA